jgi:single-strand DNA-binding protein
MNNCTFTGRLGKDAETRQVNDTTVTSFSLASDVGYGDKKTTFWLDCSIWGNRGVTLEPALVKGAKITVIGELSEREYTNKDGEVKKALSLRVSNSSYPSVRSAEQVQTPAPVVADEAVIDDEIPF